MLRNFSFSFKSLQSRLNFLMILPVGILLILLASSAFLYSRDLLLSEWRAASALQLQHAAHEVDMRLMSIENWIKLFHESSGPQEAWIHPWVIDHLNRQEGVIRVNLSWKGEEKEKLVRDESGRPRHGMDGMKMGHSARMENSNSFHVNEITPPLFDTKGEHGTVSLISELEDETGLAIGRLEIVIDFTFIFRHVVESSWWKTNKAFLVDKTGKILICTESNRRGYLADNKDPLEVRTLDELKASEYGTLLGPGYPPEEVSGYYRLKQAPWTLVMVAPSSEILAPVIKLRRIFLIVGLGAVFIIIALIRVVTTRTTSAIRKVSSAAQKLSQGDFDALVPVQSQDEVGELTKSFNEMTFQLKDRVCMKEAMGLAMELQQHFLPCSMPQIPDLDISARSVYCDETGGDFYDFIESASLQARKLGIVIGDGSGHGVSSALLMASVRSAIRTRARQTGSPSQIISDVNRLICCDTADTGHFVTLFYAEYDLQQKMLRWVRAGHEPALLVSKTGQIEELKGRGSAIGVDPDLTFQEYEHASLEEGQILFLMTDGITESRNPPGNQFGRERIIHLLREHSTLSATEILDRIVNALEEFTDNERQVDDFTLVVIKARN